MRSGAAEEQNGARELNWFQPSERDDFVSDSQLVEELGGRVVSQMDASMRRLIESTFVEGHATGCEVGGVGHRRIEDSAVVVADVTQDPMRTECGFEPRFPRGDRHRPVGDASAVLQPRTLTADVNAGSGSWRAFRSRRHRGVEGAAGPEPGEYLVCLVPHVSYGKWAAGEHIARYQVCISQVGGLALLDKGQLSDRSNHRRINNGKGGPFWQHRQGCNGR